ncbi:rhomboid family intramembrane serine protease [Reichenbachiella carrageenanivorans]|uniref:Rhomboid family intramembrane serine protease n=1 Tax=Reichenbachiella carrageenanivorans TaxID=2979869 RepID=A0ABY6CYV1_9BACT|nr:rhomboid family intramembrane serine protease [Reichenbachiella carrageenanivorans]UXX77998.1 rhomboid family intramembrane serine protease [Reichenbachiella carrageenanivorans]
MAKPAIPKLSLQNLKAHKGTYLLILINIISFDFQSDEITHISLLSEGANFAPYSLAHQPHRLITSLFLHSNFFHLLINIYSLFYIGRIIEERIGFWEFINLYFFSGVIASLTSCYLNLFIVSVGASGAIFGLYAYQFWDEWKRKQAEKKSMIINFIVFLIINLSIGQRLNIDQYAHLGGFFGGLGVYSLTYIQQFSISKWLLWVLPAFFYFIAPQTQRTYYEAYEYMQLKDGHIRSALNSDYLSHQEQAEKINVVKNLPDSIKIKFSRIENLPLALQSDTAIINNFFNYRSQQIYYFLKLLENDSYLYKDSILYINKKLMGAARPQYALGFNYNDDNSKVININNVGLKQEREYYDENWDPTPLVYKAKYYRIGTKDSLNNWHGQIVDYYVDDTPQMTGTYHRSLKQGIFIYYNKDGTISSAGCFKNDENVGKWEYYYSGNKLASEIKYIGNYSYIVNIFDSLGNQLVKDGKGIDIGFHSNGTTAYKRTIEGGLNHGIHEAYYEDGQPYFIEYHNKGDLDYGISYDTLGNVYRYDEQTEWPYPEGGFEKLIEYFESNNQMKSDEFQDYVELKFSVRTDGSIHEIVVTRSLHPTLNDHAKQLLLNGPKWHPARYRGFEIVERMAFARVNF